VSRMLVCALHSVAKHAASSNEYYFGRGQNSPACSPLPSAVIFSIRVDDMLMSVKIRFGLSCGL
jgi:hypothetical protein